LLNWRGKPISQLMLNVSLGFNPSQISSVVHGPVVATSVGGGTLSLNLPLDATDFLLFHR
jgi:hypothetical protein